jgi:hypothetical protein
MSLTKKQLLEQAGGHININVSVMLLSDLGIKDKFGGIYIAKNTSDFLNKIRQLNGTLDKDYEFKEGLWFALDEDAVGADTDVVDESFEEDEQSIEEGDKTSDTASNEPETAQEVIDASGVDWAYVDGLENTAFNKKVLEEYATPFGVDLKRNKSLPNMVMDFREALGLL